MALGPGHVSCYQLTIHARTRFGVAAKRGQLSEMPEGEQAVLFELTHRVLADAGYSAYEVSNFARSPDHESRHNRKYWDHTPYLGLGPSAHSLATADASGPAAPRRWWNERRTLRWESRVAAGERPVEAEESLGPKELATEAVMLGLRTTAGVDLDDFSGALRRRPAGRERGPRRPPRGRGPARPASRRGRPPVAGADALRTGGGGRHRRRVRHPAPELTQSAYNRSILDRVVVLAVVRHRRRPV